MSTPVSVTVKDDIAWVTINNPPVNATSTAVRAGLLDAIRGLAEVRLAVLQCAGKTFVAGGDMSEFDAPPQEPHLPDVVDAIENSAVPVIALLHGSVLGGGLEIAMACAYRVAAPKTKFGLPEVNVGLIPGAGGTQRAPRLLGWEMAVDLACLGKLKTAEDLLAIGAIDEISEDFESSVAGLVLGDITPVSSRSTPGLPSDDKAKLLSKVTKAAKGAAAPLHNFETLMLANLPYAESQPKERTLHLALRQSDESRALRHVFFAERSASKPLMIDGAKAKPIDKIAVVGGGLMGCGIAASALMAGLSVAVIEQTEEAAQKANDTVRGLLMAAVKRGKMSEAAAEERLSALQTGADYLLAQHANLVIEAIFENLNAKQSVFAEVAKVVAPDAILATNTSYLDPHEIFANVPNPERCLGIHFFSPAHIMKLVEVVKTNDSTAETIATGFALAKRLRKTPVLSGVCDGFIGNRILASYRLAAEYLLADGALPQDIDAAMRGFGMAMGPFEVQDMAGLQIAQANRRRQDATRDPKERYIPISDQICDLGRFGKRSGKGWYRYEDDSRTPLPDPVVTKIIEAYSKAQNITRQSFDAAQIQNLLLAAMANEGARIVEEGIAESDAAVDVVKTAGYGFARWRGGPMQAARALGYDKIQSALSQLEAASPHSWTRAARFQDGS
jgi:3-hydroxyacyl-CoA dehydrogenase